MKKIKIERSLKLRNEDIKNRPYYDIVTGGKINDRVWIKSFGRQAHQLGRINPNSNKTQRFEDSESLRDHWAKTLKIPTIKRNEGSNY